MSKEYSKSLIEEIRKIAADYSEAISTLPNVQDYSPEKGKEIITNHIEAAKKKAATSLETKLAKVRSQTSDVKDSINKAKFPLLSSSLESDKLRGEQMQTNSMLIFQNQFLTGNVDGVLNALNQALESKRYDLATSLIEQIKDFPAKDDSQILAKEKVNELAANYFKERGVDNFNEELNLLNYAAKLSEISKSFLEKSNDPFYLPDFDSTDYQDKMILANLEMKTGIDATPGEVDFVPFSESNQE
jgi:hypothetical protein